MSRFSSRSALRVLLPLLAVGAASCVLTPPGKAMLSYSGPGLTGRYFDGYWNGNGNFFASRTPLFSRNDQLISFSDAVYNRDYGTPLNPWGFAGTALADEETFSVEWTGQLMVESAGTYAFQTLSDDGIQVFINNLPVISNPNIHPPTINSGILSLAAGSYPVRVLYGENMTHSVAQLSWRPIGATSFSVIHTVPGPLPVMGVSAALAFSRKLRARRTAAAAPSPEH